MKVSTTAEWFHFQPFTDLHCDTGTAYGLDVWCGHKTKELGAMSWMVSKGPCTCWALVCVKWQPQQQGRYIAWAGAMQTGSCSP